MAFAANTRSLVYASPPLRTTERYLRWDATLPMTWRRGPRLPLMGLTAPLSRTRARLVTLERCIRDRRSVTGGLSNITGWNIRGTVVGS
jgi:hypothetical protein